jgi:hypothetical protein
MGANIIKDRLSFLTKKPKDRLKLSMKVFPRK